MGAEVSSCVRWGGGRAETAGEKVDGRGVCRSRDRQPANSQPWCLASLRQCPRLIKRPRSGAPHPSVLSWDSADNRKYH